MIHDTGYKIQDARYNPPQSPLAKGGSKGGYCESCIMNRAGFTLVELMITMVIFLIIIAAASGILTGMITQFKQQSKIAETNIEGAIGLEMMRRDIEHAGYGLPWVIPAGVTYSETVSSPENTFNDASNPPRAIVSGNNMSYADPNNIFDGSDYLVIKAINVAGNEASEKWTHLFAGNTVTAWEPATERLETNDRVIVLRPETRTLVVDGTRFTSRYGANPDRLINPLGASDINFAPADNTETRIVYGVTGRVEPPGTALRMPFNRADYYILKFDSGGNDIAPTRCAPNTGVLRKAIVNHSAGTFAGGTLPLLDCVADMQVVFGRNIGGTITYTNDLTGLTAQQIREQVREVRVYVLAQEGRYDRDFTFSGFTAGACATCVRVGLDNTFGRDFDFNASGITNWQNYRWKVYTMVIKPNNLR